MSTRIPVKIDAETYESVKAYAELSGKTITSVLSEACKDWMETVGQARIDCYAGQKPAEEKTLDASDVRIIAAQA